MSTEETMDRSKGLARWAILGVALLVGGILAVILWLLPAGKNPDAENPQKPGTSQNQTDTPQSGDPDAPTGETENTDPGTEITEPGETSTNGTEDPGTQTTQPGAEQTDPPATVPPEQQLVCRDYGLFSGAFVEDGSDEPVENVAAILVTNGSDQYLDLAKLTYELNGEEAVFMVTGLPAGSSAWVLEASRKTASADIQFQYVDMITSFRDDAQNTLQGVDLQFNGTMLKATNATDKTFQELTVYYKVLHDDGNYLGGITYMVTFGDLEPGQSAEKIAGHFSEEKAHIVRIGYQEG